LPQAVAGLSTLLDHSMVSPAERPDGEHAFRLLYSIRRFAAARLQNAGETLGRLERYLLNVLKRRARCRVRRTRTCASSIASS
jgi:hypothetical protein